MEHKQEKGSAAVYCLPCSLSAKEHEHGRKLLSHALKNEYNIAFTEEMLMYGEHGKPMLKSGFPHFNISHCQGMVVCALADCPVGTDIERHRRVTEPLMKKACTKEEIFYIKKGAGPEELTFWEGGAPEKTESQPRANSLSKPQILNFLKIWTLKESFMKMSGTGITKDLKEVAFDLEEDGEIRCNQGGFYNQRILRDGYILSLCTEKPVQNIVLKYENENVLN